MKRIDSSICDDVTLFKGNDSSTYCQYFKLKVPNLTLNGFHLDFFLIGHIDKLHHFVIPQSQSSEIMKSAFLQVRFAQLTLSSAKKPLLRTTPPPHCTPKPSTDPGHEPSSHTDPTTHLVCLFCNRFHCIW